MHRSPHCISCARLNFKQLVFDGVVDGVGSGFQAELLVNLAAMRLYRFYRQEHALGDFFVGEAVGYELERFEFSGVELLE